MTHTERIAVVRVDACVPHGFTLIGLYLFCGVEYDDQNAGLLARVALLLASLWEPWIIAADWQMTPAELQKKNWPRAVGGVICCCPHAHLHDVRWLSEHRLLHDLPGLSSQDLKVSSFLLASCPRMASSGQRVHLPLLIGLLFGCAFTRREQTLMCPCAGADGSLGRKLRHWTFAMCMASSTRRLMVEARNYVLNANIQNRTGVFLRLGRAVRRMLGTWHVFGAKISTVARVR